MPCLCGQTSLTKIFKRQMLHFFILIYLLIYTCNAVFLWLLWRGHWPAASRRYAINVECGNRLLFNNILCIDLSHSSRTAFTNYCPDRFFIVVLQVNPWVFFPSRRGRHADSVSSWWQWKELSPATSLAYVINVECGNRPIRLVYEMYEGNVRRLQGMRSMWNAAIGFF